jgi:D-3-phosphoglycerate dehydrogenase
MKIVCVGDVLLPLKMMKSAVSCFSRYDVVKYFFFGPATRPGMRTYIKKMEKEGPECVPVPEEILKEIGDADVLQVHMVPVPQEVFELGKKLKIVISNRGGSENIDIEAATARGIPILCNPAHNANAVAEMTIGLILAETRNIARCHASMSEHGKWLEKYPNSGQVHELHGKTAGLIGFGTVARIAAKLLSAFGMEILICDPYVKNEDAAASGVKKVDFDTLLASSDIVSMHARVSESTIGMMGLEQFTKMKRTAVFINTARPALVDMKALYTVLSEKRIMGAAIDVFPSEPVAADDPLLKLENITMTCHKGGDTTESYADSPAMVLHEAERYFAGETPRFLMNPEVLKK